MDKAPLWLRARVILFTVSTFEEAHEAVAQLRRDCADPERDICRTPGRCRFAVTKAPHGGRWPWQVRTLPPAPGSIPTVAQWAARKAAQNLPGPPN